MIGVRQRLARLETARGGEEGEILFIVTGVPSGEHDDGSGPAVARVAGQWFARDGSETTASFVKRLEDKAREAAR